ncbi:hypothetical protein ACTWPT_26740 [Nonomuraea sp. 3N208]|uniref:hypothetical protein n=1 Tax=Nonomuraea sp. 3N208 TaxID=3457421 RepID=UPI003FD0459D
MTTLECPLAQALTEIVIRELDVREDDAIAPETAMGVLQPVPLDLGVGGVQCNRALRA